MFTGIVEETGIVESVKKTEKSVELVVRAQICGKGAKVGSSIAVNGCCLTVVKTRQKGKYKLLQFDLLMETWNRTNLKYSEPGRLVNLERPVSATGQFGGHFVTGHIDGTGKIVRWERMGQDYVLDIEAPDEVMKYVVFKGSIAVDGISLTVADILPDKKGFRIWIIPHTYEVTALHSQKVGDEVNLEADILGKYVEQFLLRFSEERFKPIGDGKNPE